MARVLAWALALWLWGFAVIALFPNQLRITSSWSPELAPVERSVPYARWDSYWYWSIARSGYEWAPDANEHNTAFFPLYPALIRLLSGATGVHPFFAGAFLSGTSLVAAALLISALARKKGFDPKRSLGAVLFFPSAFFLISVYTESLFLATTCACLLSLERRQLLRTALWGFLAALTRVNGALLAIPIVAAGFEDGRAGGSGRPPRMSGFLGAAASPAAGLAAVCLYDRARFGEPFAWLEVQTAAWHHTFTWPWRTLSHAWLWTPHYRFEALVTSAFLLLAFFVWRFSKPQALYVWASLFLVLIGGRLESSIRFCVVLFPVFFVLGSWMKRSRAFEITYLASSGSLLLYRSAQFVLGRWIV